MEEFIIAQCSVWTPSVSCQKRKGLGHSASSINFQRCATSAVSVPKRSTPDAKPNLLHNAHQYIPRTPGRRTTTGAGEVWCASLVTPSTGVDKRASVHSHGLRRGQCSKVYEIRLTSCAVNTPQPLKRPLKIARGLLLAEQPLHEHRQSQDRKRKSGE